MQLQLKNNVTLNILTEFCLLNIFYFHIVFANEYLNVKTALLLL